MRWLSIRLSYRSLFLELTAAICAVVTLAFAVNAWLTIAAGRGRLLRLVEESLNLNAGAVLQRIEQHLDRCADELDYWSGLETFDEVLLQDPSMRVENLLISMQRENSELFEELTAIDASGVVVASTRFESIGRTIALDELQLRPEPGSRLLLGDFPTIDESPGRDLPMAHPINSRLAPHPIGWIVARASWRPVLQLVSGPGTAEGAEGVESFLLLVDDDGHVLAATRGFFEKAKGASDLLARLENTDEVADLPTRFGEYLATHHSSDAPRGSAASRLRMVALWKRSEVYSVVDTFVWVGVGSAALGLLLATGASFGIARTITRRIRGMVQGTSRLALGDLDHRVEEGRADELGNLARSFNSMAGRLAYMRRELKEAAAQWKALVTHAPDLILTVSLNGRIEFINRVVSGLERDTVIGASVYEFMSEKHHQAYRHALDEVRRTGEARGLQVEGFGPNGGTAWYSVRIGPIIQEDKVVAFTIIATDITDQKRLESDILEVSEQERERMGQDLHDDLGQTLTGISLLNKSLEQKLKSGFPAAGADVDQIGRLIADAIRQTRSLARGLVPIGLERQGLHGALGELASDVGTLFGVDCTFEGDPIELERTRARHLFRIAQEAVNNALKHAKARSIRIRLENGPGQRILSVTDDGIGIPAARESTAGMGLRLMEYRASMIGGSLDVRAGPRGGTVVDCRF